MKSYDIFLTVVIILIFFMCNLVTILVNGIDEIKRNWPKYRCNPMIMPFAGLFGQDPVNNFAFCIGAMQKDMMGKFTAPIKFKQNKLLSNIDSISAQTQSFRKFQSSFKNTAGFELFNIFTLMDAILTMMKSFIIHINEMIQKILGMIAVLLYMMEGAGATSESFLEGPIYELLQTIKGIGG